MDELKKIPWWGWAALAVALLYFMSKRAAARAPQFSTAGVPAPSVNAPSPSSIAPSAPTSSPSTSGIDNVVGLLGAPLPQNFIPINRTNQDGGPVTSPPPPLGGLQWL